jgi:hypothetical protein
MNNYKVLEKGLQQTDDLKKLAYINTYILVQYSMVETRTRKPFNPVLGETYELV